MFLSLYALKLAIFNSNVIKNRNFILGDNMGAIIKTPGLGLSPTVNISCFEPRCP